MSTPALPPGGPLELPGRGTTFHRDLPSRAGADAPVVLLLHGWTATADLNWYPAYDPLAADFRVLALDHRGHGRGIRSGRRFRLADCADDAVALADVLGVGPLHPGRVLDGWPGRPAALAPPPDPGRRAWSSAPPPATSVAAAPRRARSPPSRRWPPPPASHRPPCAPVPPSALPTAAPTRPTGPGTSSGPATPAWCSRRARPSGASRRGTGSPRSTCPPRWFSPSTTPWSPLPASRSWPTPSPAPPCTGPRSTTAAAWSRPSSSCPCWSAACRDVAARHVLNPS